MVLDDGENIHILRPTPRLKKKLSYDVNLWNKDFQEWLDGSGPRPGPHPSSVHDFNTTPYKYNPNFDEDDELSPRKELENKEGDISASLREDEKIRVDK